MTTDKPPTPRIEEDHTPRCSEGCHYVQYNEQNIQWCGKTGLHIFECDICVPYYHIQNAELRGKLGQAREWYEYHVSAGNGKVECWKGWHRLRNIIYLKEVKP